VYEEIGRVLISIYITNNNKKKTITITNKKKEERKRERLITKRERILYQ